MQAILKTDNYAVKALNFLVFSNIFISLCAAAMSAFTQSFLKLKINADYLLFVFFGTICSYSFHWYLPGNEREGHSRDEWNSRHKKIHLVLFAAGFTGSVFFFIKL